MTQNVYLVYKSQPQIGARVVDGIVTALVNSDSSANAIKNAALAANQYKVPTTDTDDSEKDFFDAASVLFPATYFDTAVIASATPPASGNLSANGDCYVVPAPNAVPVFVSGSSYTPVS